jgi:hypothetical protein
VGLRFLMVFIQLVKTAKSNWSDDQNQKNAFGPQKTARLLSNLSNVICTAASPTLTPSSPLLPSDAPYY